MKHVYSEPDQFDFEDIDGHSGKFFNTSSKHTNHLIIKCDDHLKAWYTQTEVEFNYYVTEGSGYFIVEETEHQVNKGDLINIPPGIKYTFGGKLKMLLINTQIWTEEQQKREPRESK